MESCLESGRRGSAVCSGNADHFAIGVESFNRDAVTANLKEMGLTPRENLEFGFHVKDPDGANVQITGI